MFKAGYVRVITENPGDYSVKLRDLIHDARWTAAVEASALKEHYLSLMAYEDFVAAPTSRVLSYRWNEKVTFKDTPVSDPAGIVTSISGDVALSVLKTPLTKWKILWADALNHLNDPSGVGMTISSMGQLYVKVPTLPQYFLTGDMKSLEEAINRGWMHQELAYGVLDFDAVWSFIEILAKSMPDVWRGNPFNIPPFIMLMQFVAKRVRSAATEVPLQSRLEQIASLRGPNMTHTIDASYAMFSLHILSFMMKIIGSKSSVFRDLSSGKPDDECKEALGQYIAEIASAQLNGTIEENLLVLRTNPVFCLGIIKACCSTNFWDKSDAYVASIAVIGTACGFSVDDPLRDYRARFSYSTMPRNSDGTLNYSHTDLNLEVLNNNLELLRICWATVNQGNYRIPYAFRGMNAQSEMKVDLTQIPTGMHTLGFGLIPIANANAARPVFVGTRSTFTFSEKLDGYEVNVSESPVCDDVIQSIAPFPSLESLADMRYVRYVGPMAVAIDVVRQTAESCVERTTESGVSAVVDAATSTGITLPILLKVNSRPLTPKSSARSAEVVFTEKLPPL
jgi:hypothetical protein